MMDRLETNSIRFRMTAAAAVIMLVLLAILVFCFSFSARTVRTQVYTTYQSILSTYIHGLENNLDNVESYLISAITDNEDLAILDTFGSRWSLAASRQQEDLTDAIITYSMADGFFIFEPDNDLWIDATVSNYDNTHRRAVRQYISESVVDNASYHQLKNWGAARIGEEYVLFRILRAQGCYVGAWVRADTITEDFKLGERTHAGQLLLAGSKELYSSQLEPLRLDPSAASESYQMSGGYMAVSRKSEKMGAYLVLLLKDDTITRELDWFQALIIVISLCALASLGAMFFASYRILVKPLNRLTAAMQTLQKGNWDIRLPEETELDEYADINATFNHMVEQVECLKIANYEQETEKLHIENQMLKQQMAPHTLINCLNTMHGLAGSGNTELVQTMAEDLGKHLRYLLSGEQTIAFGQELDHARNYLKICNIRYANGITMEENIAPEVMKAHIPPLMIHGFVENSVKYALSPSRPTCIGLSAWREGEKLQLRMWDNGPGYDKAMLEKLARTQNIVSSSSGERIGLVNLCRRTQLLYGDENAYVRFHNGKDGGAEMEASIPYTTTEGWVE